MTNGSNIIRFTINLGKGWMGYSDIFIHWQQKSLLLGFNDTSREQFQRVTLWVGPYFSPAFRSIISLRGPSKRVNACASSAATFNLGFEGSVRYTALTVAARGARSNRE